MFHKISGYPLKLCVFKKIPTCLRFEKAIFCVFKLQFFKNIISKQFIHFLQNNNKNIKPLQWLVNRPLRWSASHQMLRGWQWLAQSPLRVVAATPDSLVGWFSIYLFILTI
jgi:hypothetical protein